MSGPVGRPDSVSKVVLFPFLFRWEACTSRDVLYIFGQFYERQSLSFPRAPEVHWCPDVRIPRESRDGNVLHSLGSYSSPIYCWGRRCRTSDNLPERGGDGCNRRCVIRYGVIRRTTKSWFWSRFLTDWIVLQNPLPQPCPRVRGGWSLNPPSPRSMVLGRIRKSLKCPYKPLVPLKIVTKFHLNHRVLIVYQQDIVTMGEERPLFDSLDFHEWSRNHHH